MRPVQVQSPDGTQWRVRRRWLPRHENLGRKLLRTRAERRQARAVRVAERKEKESRWWDALDLTPFDLFDDIGFALLAVVAVVFLLLWGWPFLVALLDVVLVLLLAIAGLVARVVFRRPWLVEATGGEARLSRAVVGWRASSRMVDAWAEELRHGRGLEPPVF